MTKKTPQRRARTGLAIGLVVLALCLGLAAWQWQRADQARAWQAAEQQKAASAPLPLDLVLAMRERQHQPIRLHGHIDNAHPVLLDNRTFRQRAGYYLLSALQTGDGHWVLVNRGWLPAGRNRDRLPAIAPVVGPVTLTGTVHVPGHNVFLPSGGPPPASGWPLRVAEVDFAAIGARLGVELAPFEVRLGPAPLSGPFGAPLPRPWKTVEATISPARHVAYAVQWVAIGIAGLLVFTLAGRRPSPGRRGHRR